MVREVARQLTLFLPAAVAERVQPWREQFDPVMAQRIAPHVTLVHDLVDLATARLVFETGVPSVTLTLGHVACWERPASGIYVTVTDGAHVLERLRLRLGCSAEDEAQYTPHVTLLHHRTGAARAEAAWEALRHQQFDVSVTFDRVSVVEVGDDLCREVQRFDLRG